MNILILLLSIFLNFTSFTVNNDESHAIYIAVIEINHAENANQVNVIMKLFSDDLLNALKNKFPQDEIKSEPLLCPDYQGYISSYFKDHFKLVINGNAVNPDLVNCLQQGDSHWLEMSFESPATWTSVELFADLFMELFPTQSNIVTLKNAGNNLFYRLTKNSPDFKVEF